jgi:hypothetical protein
MHEVIFSRLILCSLLCLSMMLAKPAHPQGSRGDDRLPVLYGVKLDSTQITIDVESFGCTDASYFSVQLDPASSDTYHLSIVRRRQDRCRMSAHVVGLTLDLPKVPNLTSAKFFLMNNLAAPITLHRSDR